MASTRSGQVRFHSSPHSPGRRPARCNSVPMAPSMSRTGPACKASPKGDMGAPAWPAVLIAAGTDARWSPGLAGVGRKLHVAGGEGARGAALRHLDVGGPQDAVHQGLAEGLLAE